jgi:hypothetical protein
MEHIASYVTPQPIQQISSSGKKISGGDSSSKKFVTAVVSSDPLISLVDVVIDRVDAANAQLVEVAFHLRSKLMQSCQENLLQNASFKKAKDGLKLRAPVPQLPATSKQGTHTSTKRKTTEVE